MKERVDFRQLKKRVDCRELCEGRVDCREMCEGESGCQGDGQMLGSECGHRPTNIKARANPSGVFFLTNLKLGCALAIHGQIKYYECDRKQ